MRRHKGERDVEKSLRDMKDCGFTASCFLEAKDIPACRAAGLHPIVYPFRAAKEGEIERGSIDTFFISSDGRISVSAMLKDKKATQEMIDEAVKEALVEMPPEPFTLYVVDEPGAGSYQRIKWMVDSVKKYRPDLDTHINLFPNYAMCGKPDMSQLETETYDQYLEKYCEMLGDTPLSVDSYDIIIGMDNQNKGAEKRYYLNLIQCRDACDKYGVEFHFIVNSNQLRNFLTVPTMANLMLQAFTVIAAGARSLAWFTYFGRNDYCYAPVDDNGDEDIRTPVWYLLREVNRRALSMGEHLYGMEYKGMYFSDTLGISRAKNVSECPEIKGFSSDLPCMVGMYEDNGESVAVIVNMSLEHSTKFDIDLGGELLWWSTEENRYIRPLITAGNKLPGAVAKTTPMWLAPGDAIIVRSKK